MFDLGFQELIVIFLVALIVFGPKKLPELGRSLGKWITEIKRGVYSARLQMENEFHDLEKNLPADSDGSEKKSEASMPSPTESHDRKDTS